MPTVKMPDGQLVDMPDNPTPEQLQRLKQLSSPGVKATELVKETGRVLDKFIRGGLFAIPDFMAMLGKGGEWLAKKSLEPLVGKERVEAAAADAPTIFKIVELAKKYTGGEVKQPKTKTGKYLGAAGEGMVAAAAGPGGLANLGKNLAIGGAAGTGGEAAANAFGDNPLARLVGSIAAGGLTTVGASHIPNAETLIKQAISQVPEASWRRAGQLEDTLKNAKISHLKSQLLGPTSTLDDLIAVAGSHPSVRPSLLSAVKNSPEEAKKAFNTWSAGILPPDIGGKRAILEDVQGTAAAAIKELEDEANVAYRQNLPSGVSHEYYGRQQINAIKDDLIALVKDPERYGPKSTGGKALTRFIREYLPDLKPMQVIKKGYINNNIKDLNTIAEKPGYKGLPIEDLKRVLKAHTEADFGAARAAKTEFMQKVVNPTQRGLAGQLAQMGGGIKQDRHTATETVLKIVFPEHTAQPIEIKKLGQDIGADSVGHLLREHLSTNMEKAVKLQKREGMTLQAPFDFLASIAGTGAQRKNIEAALNVVARDANVNPATVRIGFYKLMQAFKTTADLKLPETVDRATLAQQAGLNIPGLIVAPQSRAGRFLWERMTKKTYTKIAEIVTSSDGLKQLKTIAEAKDPNAAATFARAVLAAADENNSPELTNNN